MSKKKKRESKKQRKNRIIGHSISPKHPKEQTNPFSFPKTWEEAARMGILR